MNAKTMTIRALKPNGVLPVELGWHGGFQKFEITGGPYDAFVRDSTRAFGVCVRAERVPDDFDLRVPIRDFDVPTDDREVQQALWLAISAALEGKKVYVGCMGGWGRTGLFLALIAKACGVENPVAYVRSKYTPRAVETQDQQAYVASFDVTSLQSRIRWAGWTKTWSDALFGWWQ